MKQRVKTVNERIWDEYVANGRVLEKLPRWKQQVVKGLMANFGLQNKLRK